MVDKTTQTQLINGRLAIARLAVDNKPEGNMQLFRRLWLRKLPSAMPAASCCTAP